MCYGVFFYFSTFFLKILNRFVFICRANLRVMFATYHFFQKKIFSMFKKHDVKIAQFGAGGELKFLFVFLFSLNLEIVLDFRSLCTPFMQISFHHVVSVCAQVA